ncbi:MAG: hypothetical protein HY721_28170 [Planctomycetes bacterium]|nr:hypothetical protein [Planctomycetota bacterium]
MTDRARSIAKSRLPKFGAGMFANVLTPELGRGPLKKELMRRPLPDAVDEGLLEEAQRPRDADDLGAADLEDAEDLEKAEDESDAGDAPDAEEDSPAEEAPPVAHADPARRYTLLVAMRPGRGADEATVEREAWAFLSAGREVRAVEEDGTEHRGAVVESYIHRGPAFGPVEAGTPRNGGDWLLGVIWDDEAGFAAVVPGRAALEVEGAEAAP